MFQMPLSRLSVRPADLRPVLFHQSANGRVTVHRLEHLQARAIQPHDRQVVIEGREPPFVFTVLIGDEIGDVPGQETECLSGEVERLVGGDSWFHDRCCNLFERRSLHERPGFSQGLTGGEAPLVGELIANGV